MELLHSKNLSPGQTGGSTQKYVDVEEIKNGVIFLKNGSLRVVLLVSSINFDLKSTDEQDAIIGQYQNFLNSLDFPTQIVISSRKLNIKPYLDFLKDKSEEITNELLHLQLTEYMNFIKSMTEVTNIMSKYFYIVVPFSPVETKEGGIIDKFTSIFNPKRAVETNRGMLTAYENQLWQRVDHIIAGLSGIGVKVVALNTEEIIELLYNSYNPNISSKSVVYESAKTTKATQ